jgi:hypothetical protein
MGNANPKAASDSDPRLDMKYASTIPTDAMIIRATNIGTASRRSRLGTGLDNNSSGSSAVTKDMGFPLECGSEQRAECGIGQLVPPPLTVSSAIGSQRRAPRSH